MPAPYFPLGRFGKHYVAVRDSNGELVHFAMHESQFDAKKGEREAQIEYPGADGHDRPPA